MKRFTILMFVVVLSFPLASVHADDFDGGFSLGLNAGTAFLLGDVDSPSEPGVALGLELRCYASPYVSLSGLVGYSHVLDNVAGFADSRIREYGTHIVPLGLGIRAEFLPEKKINPFLGVGAIAAYWESEDNPLPYPDDRRELSGWTSGVRAEAGVEVPLDERWSLELSGKEIFYFSDDLDNIMFKDSKDDVLFKGFVGLVYKFGMGPKDRDMDGILDAQDRCPDELEDLDGFQDEDGCPDPDNDGDGIADIQDRCPNKRETFNGYKDKDGCPDKKPLLEKKGAKLVLKGMNFQSGSAALTEASYATLDEIATGLKDNSEVEIEIRGYTDDTGSAAVNQKLSERRATSVMQYLINAGIEAARLSAVGYGEKGPISSNKTREGRAQNRRIEFFRIK